MKFIRFFINGWKQYPSFSNYFNNILGKEKTEAIINMDENPEKSRRMLRSRLYYAFENARIYYRHRDRYGRKCRKMQGDCERCDARHC